MFMNNKVFTILKIAVKYLILVFIFKNIHYLVGIKFNDLEPYFIIFIPIVYLIVKYLILIEFKNNNITRKDVLTYLTLYITGINLIFNMPIMYDIIMLIFLILLKDKKDKQKEIIEKNLRNYKK